MNKFPFRGKHPADNQNLYDIKLMKRNPNRDNSPMLIQQNNKARLQELNLKYDKTPTRDRPPMNIRKVEQNMIFETRENVKKSKNTDPMNIRKGTPFKGYENDQDFKLPKIKVKLRVLSQTNYKII